MGSAIFVVIFVIVASAVIMRKDEWNELMEELKRKLEEEKINNRRGKE